MSNDGEPANTPAPTHDEDWRTLADRASKEQDPQKLLGLLQRFSAALDREHQRNRVPLIPSRKSESEPEGNQQTG